MLMQTVTDGQRQILVNKWGKVFKRLGLVKSRVKYLHECQKHKIVPQGLILPFLIKSEELWKGNKARTLEVLLKGSVDLQEVQLSRWEKEKDDIEEKIRKFQKDFCDYFEEEEGNRLL